MTEPFDSRPDPLVGPFTARLRRGAGYLVAGWRLVRSERSLVVLSLGPIAVGLLAFAGMLGALAIYGSELAAMIWSKPEGSALRALWTVFEVVLFLTLLLVGLGLSYVVQSLLAAPFNELISERVERLVLEGDPPQLSGWQTMRGAVRALIHEAGKVSLWVGAMGPLFVIGLVVPVVGTLIWSVGGFFVTARFAAYDAVDHCMARREWSFARKLSFIRQHRALTFGLGAAAAGLVLVPVFAVAVSPVAAAGGTLLFCDIQRANQQQRRGAIGQRDRTAGGVDAR